MLYLRHAMLISSLLFTAIFCLPAIADARSDLQKSISQTNSKLAANNAAVETLENRIASYIEKQRDAEEKLVKAKEDYQQAVVNLETANKNTAEDGATQQELAQKMLSLAKNGLESRQSRLSSITAKNVELAQELQVTKLEVASLTKSAAEQQRKLANTPKAPVVAKPTVVAAPAPIVKASAPIVAAPAAIADVAPAQVDEPELAAVAQLELTESQIYAREQMAQLNRTIKGADKSDGRYSELIMKIDRTESVELEHLGAHQFYSEINLDEGVHRMQIRTRTYRIKIDAEYAGEKVVVIYDASRRNEPNFISFYKKDLQ